MDVSAAVRDLVMAVSPCGDLAPSPRVAVAARMAGGTGVLDLARGGPDALTALRMAASWSTGPIGVRVPEGCAATPGDLPADAVDLVVLGPGSPWQAADLAGRYRVLVEVTSRAEAGDAARAGAHGLVLRGFEGGGRVSELSTFVLLQQLLADE